ncbi:MAG: M16 family metallopeptidase [Candidatus Velthaea sp.]
MSGRHVLAALLLVGIPLAVTAQPVSAPQITPPPPGPARNAALPAPAERTLASGLRVIAFQQRSAPKAAGVPLIAAQLIVRGGASAESEAEAGLSALTASLLTQGTTKRSAIEIAQQIDALGARLDATSGYDASVVSVSATTPVFAQAFTVFNEVVRQPAFAPAEVERARAKSISDLGLMYSNPSALARLVANRVVFGGTAYGHPLAGTAETLGALTRADVAHFHERYFRPDNAVLVIGGDIAPADAFALAERVIGSWSKPAAPLATPAPLTPPAPRPVVLAVDKPDAGRTAVVAGRVAISRRSPEYYAGTVATAVLAGYSGRLNQEIRVKRGLSYGASAQLATRRASGMFVASTLVDHAKAAEAVDVMLATLAGVGKTAVDDADLATRKATVTGGFYRGIETIDGIASTLGELALYDVPVGDLTHYVARINAIAPGDVRRFAQASIASDDFVVLVGNTKLFADAVRAAHPGLRVIPFAQLDLNRADLEKK